GEGLEVHALAPARDPGLEAPAPLVEPRPPGGASDQIPDARAEGGAAGPGRATAAAMSGALLLGCDQIAKAYGSAPLFEGLSFGLFEGDRVGLIGPNGSGKSTLLKILAGLETPDAGTRSLRRQVRVGYVAQDPTFSPGR